MRSKKKINALELKLKNMALLTSESSRKFTEHIFKCTTQFLVIFCEQGLMHPKLGTPRYTQGSLKLSSIQKNHSNSTQFKKKLASVNLCHAFHFGSGNCHIRIPPRNSRISQVINVTNFEEKDENFKKSLKCALTLVPDTLKF